MDRLRPRKRKIPSEFTNSEVQELEYYVTELGEQSLNQKFCAKIADAFSRSVGRAGKSRVTWDEIQRWLQDKHRELMDKAESIPVQPDQHTKLPDGGMNVFALDEACNPVEAHDRCWTTDIPAATLQKTMLNKHIDFTFLLNENTLLPIIIMVDSTQLPIIVLVDGCIPVNSLEQCQAIGVPSSSELNEDSSEPVKVQEQRIAISSQIPSPFQFNGSTHHLDASSNLVVPADESLRIKAHEQSTTQVPSSTQTHIKGCTHLPGVSEPCMTFPAVRIPNGAGDTNKFTKGEKFSDLSEVEFEARSSKDEAWYDVERVLTHRILSSGEAEVRVRYVGYGAEEDEWVNVKNSVRERSLPVEHWECYRVKVGDLVLCFQERDDQAIYFDAHVLDIQRRMHDIRGCRCIFLVRYNHDITEEKVRLRRLCRRP